MKITDYPIVNELSNGDVFLIDGGRGTKQLNGEYIRGFLNSFYSRYENRVNHWCEYYSGNLNDITVNSIYNVSGAVNSPAGVSDWGFVITLVHCYTSNYLTQIYISMTSSSSSNGVFWRIKTGSDSSWHTWQKLNSEEEMADKWATGKSYAINSIVSYQGSTYRCIRAHTSGSNLSPTNTSYWEQRTLGAIIKNNIDRLDSMLGSQSIHTTSTTVTTKQNTYVNIAELRPPSAGNYLVTAKLTYGDSSYNEGIRCLRLYNESQNLTLDLVQTPSKFGTNTMVNGSTMFNVPSANQRIILCSYYSGTQTGMGVDGYLQMFRLS